MSHFELIICLSSFGDQVVAKFNSHGLISLKFSLGKHDERLKKEKTRSQAFKVLRLKMSKIPKGILVKRFK